MSSLPLGILASSGGAITGPLLYRYTNSVYTTGSGPAAQTFLNDQSSNGEDAIVRLNGSLYVDQNQAPVLNEYGEFTLYQNQDVLLPSKNNELLSWTMSIWVSRPTVVTDPQFDKASYAFYFTNPHPNYSDFMAAGIMSSLTSNGDHRIGFGTFVTLIPGNPSFWLPRGHYAMQSGTIAPQSDKLFQHLALTYNSSINSGQFIAYLNGNQFVSSGGNNSSFFKIKTNASKIINSANGQRSVKDARLYDTALTQSQIQAIYNEGYLSPRYA